MKIGDFYKGPARGAPASRKCRIQRVNEVRLNAVKTFNCINSRYFCCYCIDKSNHISVIRKSDFYRDSPMFQKIQKTYGD